MKLTVLIACFNEKATILEAIREAKQLNIDKEIIVIDNCSTDGTQEILRGLRDDSIQIVFRSKNFGPGGTAKLAIELAKGDYFFSPCADLEYKMSDVYEMFKKMEADNLDVVFGSRLLAMKDISRIKLIKERPFWLGSIITTFLTNKFYNRKFTDIIAPKLLKTSILKDLSFNSDSQAFEFELVSRLCKKGCSIGEVPIFYSPRTHKEGKTIRVLDMLPALKIMLKIKLFG